MRIAHGNERHFRRTTNRTQPIIMQFVPLHAFTFFIKDHFAQSASIFHNTFQAPPRGTFVFPGRLGDRGNATADALRASAISEFATPFRQAKEGPGVRRVFRKELSLQ